MKLNEVIASLFQFFFIRSVFIFVCKVSTTYTFLVNETSGETTVRTQIDSQNVSSISSDLGLSCSLAFNGLCCSESHFQCNDGSCIPFHKLCDSFPGVYNLTDSNSNNVTLKVDCSDGSDEFGCSYLPCSKRKHDCGFHCFDLPDKKSVCSCHKGSISSNGIIACSSINHCEHELHTCSHNCLNSEDSYQCSCKDGFKNDDSPHYGSCKAINRSVIILFNTGNYIYSYDLERNFTTGNISSGKVVSMDYDPETDLIYWWNPDQHILERAGFLNAKDVNVTKERPVEKLSVLNRETSMTRISISIDWSVGNLYWISHSNHKHITSEIFISKIDGSSEESVFVAQGVKITSLVVDPLESSIYWTNVGPDPGITVSCTLGISVRTFVKLDQQYPKALTLDHGHGRLFWFDVKSHSIFARYKKGRKTVKIALISKDLSPENMDAFENHLYWVSKQTGLLVRLEKFGRGKPEIIMNSLHKPTAIKVHHSLKYGHPSSELIDKKLRIKCKQCTDVCVNLNHVFKCYQDLKKNYHVKFDSCKHFHNCSMSDRKSTVKHHSHSHKLRNELIVLIVVLSSLLVFGTCFVIFLFKRRQRYISKFIQLDEVN